MNYNELEKKEIRKQYDLDFLNVSNQYTFDIGKETIKNAILINGALAIAILAFLGTCYSTKDNLNIDYLSISLIVAVVGVLSGVVSMGFVYFSQFRYTTTSYWEIEGYNREAAKKRKQADLLRCGAIISTFIAYSTFMWGSLFGLFGILNKIHIVYFGLGVLLEILLVLILSLIYKTENVRVENE